MRAKPAPTSTRTMMAGAVVASLVPGCFALFSLDEYGPPADTRDAAAAVDAATDARDATSPDAKLPGRTIFVTRETFAGDLGGLDGGDDKCQAVAVDAGYGGSFRAWLADDRVGIERLVLDAGPLQLPNGAFVASSTLDLATRGPQNAIVIDQRGQVTGGGGCADGGTVAWTGALQDGGSAGANDCQRWRAQGAQQMGVVGLVGGDGGAWAAACIRSCQTLAVLYCIQQ